MDTYVILGAYLPGFVKAVKQRFDDSAATDHPIPIRIAILDEYEARLVGVDPKIEIHLIEDLIYSVGGLAFDEEIQEASDWTLMSDPGSVTLYLVIASIRQILWDEGESPPYALIEPVVPSATKVEDLRREEAERHPRRARL